MGGPAPAPRVVDEAAVRAWEPVGTFTEQLARRQIYRDPRREEEFVAAPASKPSSAVLPALDSSAVFDDTATVRLGRPWSNYLQLPAEDADEWTMLSWFEQRRVPVSSKMRVFGTMSDPSVQNNPSRLLSRLEKQKLLKKANAWVKQTR